MNARTKITDGKLVAAVTGLGALGLWFLIGLALPTSASASHCTSSGKLKSIEKADGDKFKNYDFTSQNAGRCNIDWPVNFVFKGNADIDKVKSRMDGQGYLYAGSTMNAYLKDNSSWRWDQDGGKKNDIPCFNDIEHFRIYAPPNDDSFYNTVWGYYVIGTSHIDHNEACPGEWFGKSERAEGRIASDTRDEWGSSAVNEDSANMQNHHDFRRSGPHILNNSGYATKVTIP